MKKRFKDRKFIKGLMNVGGSILKGGILDVIFPVFGVTSTALVGLKSSLTAIADRNVSNTNGGVGKVDYLRWASFGIVVVLSTLFIFGKIDLETFEYLFDVFERLD